MSNSSSNSEPAYLGSIVVVAITVVVIIETESSHLLWTGQDILEGGESIVVQVKWFSLRSVGCASAGLEQAALENDDHSSSPLVHHKSLRLGRAFLLLLCIFCAKPGVLYGRIERVKVELAEA